MSSNDRSSVSGSIKYAPTYLKQEGNEYAKILLKKKLSKFLFENR